MLVNKILKNDILGFHEDVSAKMSELLEKKLVQMKEQVAYSTFGLDEDFEYDLVEDEDGEQIDELSKLTLGRYVKGASAQSAKLSDRGREASMSGDHKTAVKHFGKAAGRAVGIHAAIDRLTDGGHPATTSMSKKTKAAYAKANEDEELDEAAVTGTKLGKSGKRWKIVRVRVRKGKVQRNKRVTNVAGYTFRDSNKNRELTRMSPQERRNRKRGQKRGKIKRKAKMSAARLKRKRSDRKRTALGL